MLAEDVAFLQSLEPSKIVLGLDTIRALCDALGNPEKSLKFIHVAGTNGKGSTAATLFSIFKEAGCRVGLYTSPHLVEFRERMRTDRGLISEDEFSKKIQKIKPILADLRKRQVEPTFFEATTAIALDWFRDQKVDLVILETGLGGRLDATNVVTPEVCVITNISLDHQVLLGDTMEKIAAEKAGIIKAGVPVFMAKSVPEVLAVLERKAVEEDAKFKIIDPPVMSRMEGCMQFFDFEGLQFSTPLLGGRQLQNVALAIAAALCLRQIGWDVPNDALVRGVRNVQWLGRFQFLSEDPVVVLDGAHNEEGVSELIKNWRAYFKRDPGRVIFGMLKDKDVAAMLKQLKGLDSEFWIVPISSKRSMEPLQLSKEFSKSRQFVSVCEAMDAQRELPHSDGTLIMGSLYLVGEILGQMKMSGAELSLNV